MPSDSTRAKLFACALLALFSLAVPLRLQATEPPASAQEAQKAQPAELTLEERDRLYYERTHTCRGYVLNPYEVWRGVSDQEQAALFLRRNYERIGSIEGFVDWLRCQGFGISVTKGPRAPPYLKEGETRAVGRYEVYVNASYRPPLWGSYWFSFLEPVSHYVDIIFDRDGKIRYLAAVDMSK